MRLTYLAHILAGGLGIAGFVALFATKGVRRAAFVEAATWDLLRSLGAGYHTFA